MDLDAVLLSRIQFAPTIVFHYLFPPLTIGMGVVLVYLEGMYLWTKNPLYESATKFWIKLFAINFAIGAASGIVMEFQFGTNWATYSRFVGDVFGSALAAEGTFAFFLESGFLAVLVFGWDRVGPKMHFFSTCMVALGSIFSSIWIVIANSWQQTPAGHKFVPVLRDGEPFIVNGEPVFRAEIVDFWAVFNPSTVHRLVHVWLGCFIVAAFFILSISAWYLLRNRHREFAQRSVRGALILATVSSITILFSGHSQARNVYKHQPAKLAAFEGHYETATGDLTLVGIPNEAGARAPLDLADVRRVPGALYPGDDLHARSGASRRGQLPRAPVDVGGPGAERAGDHEHPAGDLPGPAGVRLRQFVREHRRVRAAPEPRAVPVHGGQPA